MRWVSWLRLVSSRLFKPNGSRWYWLMDSQGKLLTDSTDPTPFGSDFDFSSGEPENFYLEKGKPNQYYYKTGLFVAMCVYCYDIFGDNAFIDAAKKCMDFSLECHADVTRTMLGHKVQQAQV